MSVASLDRPGGLPQGLSALLGQLSPLSATGNAVRGAGSDFDDSSAKPRGAGSAANSALTGDSKAALSDQTLGFLSKLQEQPSSDANSSLSAPGSTAQFPIAIRAFENAMSAMGGGLATTALTTPSNAFWQSAMPAGATTDLIA